MELIDRFGDLLAGRGDDGIRAELDGDTLCIDCGGCGQVPDIRSGECVRCVVGRISALGNADRIRLRAGRDLEVFGDAAEVLCDLASLDRLVRGAASSTGLRCGACEHSCKRIVEEVWEDFPEPRFGGVRGRLMGFRAEDRRCVDCIQATYRLLDQAEIGLEEIRRKTLRTGNTGGWR